MNPEKRLKLLLRVYRAYGLSSTQLCRISGYSDRYIERTQNSSSLLRWMTVVEGILNLTMSEFFSDDPLIERIMEICDGYRDKN